MTRLAVYAGSFDPPTNGHIDVVQRIAPHFDCLYLVVADNPRKKSLFTAPERVEMLQGAIQATKFEKLCKVTSHGGLIVNFCKEVGAKVLIRGLRAVSDFETEFQIASMNRTLDPNIETLHVMTDEKYLFISSTLIKEVAQFGTDKLRELVPVNVEKALVKRFKK